MSTTIPVRLERTMDTQEPGWTTLLHLPAVPRVGEHLEVTDEAGVLHTGTVRTVMWPIDPYDAVTPIVRFR